MKVKAKNSNRFLIKDEWYQVSNINDVEKGDGSRFIHYELDNHTDKVWNTSWYSSVNFLTLQELRENKLKELGV
jgi:hypothetical protein